MGKYMKKLRERVEDFCREYQLLEPGDGVVAGLSGGADSVCLLKLLASLREAYGLSIAAVHVNHGIRGEEAGRDEAFAVELAASLGIPCRVFREDIPAMAAAGGMSEEEAGRIYRYQCFRAVAEELGFQKIAVAHHRDDQAETVLFQMLRGSGLRGLCGMRPKNGAVIRPLLCISRAQIEEALEEEGTAYCQDGTNQQTEYSRNLLRHRVLPVMEEINQGAGLHLADTAEKLWQVMDYIDGRSLESYERLVESGDGCCRVSQEQLLALPEVLQGEVLLRMIGHAAGQRKDIGSVHVRLLQELAGGGTGKSLSLPYGLQAVTSYGELRIGKEGRALGETEESLGSLDLRAGIPVETGITYEILHPGGILYTIVFEKRRKENLSSFNAKNYCTKFFSYDRMDCMPVLRYPERGDFLWLDGDGRSKRLSRLFIDEKLPADRRERTPVLALGHHIVWIPSLGRVSAGFYVQDNTKELLCADIVTVRNCQ